MTTIRLPLYSGGMTSDFDLLSHKVDELARLAHALRRELVRDELVLRDDGTLPLPSRPGLGIELDRERLAEFSAAAARISA